MKLFLTFSAMMALACVSAAAAPKKAAHTSPQKQVGATTLNISVAECQKIHGGLFLTNACHSGAACRTTSANGDGEIEYHDERLSAK
jgi:hypothetical protein